MIRKKFETNLKSVFCIFFLKKKSIGHILRLIFFISEYVSRTNVHNIQHLRWRMISRDSHNVCVNILSIISRICTIPRPVIIFSLVKSMKSNTNISAIPLLMVLPSFCFSLTVRLGTFTQEIPLQITVEFIETHPRLKMIGA